MTGESAVGRFWRGRPGTAMPRAPRTVAEVLARTGRVVLWLAVLVVLARGLAATFAAPRPVIAARVDAGVRAAAWPDDAARAFAIEFATAYLTHSPDQDPDGLTRALEAFASPELVAQLAPRYEARTRQAVRSATVARVVDLDGGHALVSVAVTLAGPESVRRLVTVPVARDEAGALAVYDLPSFTSAPARAAVSAPETEPLLGQERAAITDVLTRFLRAYLAGDTSGLAYLVPPGTRLSAAAGRWKLVDVTSVAVDGPAPGRGERRVLAGVLARDPVSRVVYALRYRVRLMRRDRWYVADLNGPREG
jgi:hypothetical protein